jgi:hypothetical protein
VNRNGCCTLHPLLRRRGAERIRKAAKAERRTVSGFILNAVFNRIQLRDKLTADAQGAARQNPQFLKHESG